MWPFNYISYFVPSDSLLGKLELVLRSRMAKSICGKLSGIEPLTSCMPRKCLSQLSPAPQELGNSTESSITLSISVLENWRVFNHFNKKKIRYGFLCFSRILLTFHRGMGGVLNCFITLLVVLASWTMVKKQVGP